MIINSITIKNVRSFNEETTINFKRDLNILIGPNGGGKSNLLDILNIEIRAHLLHSFIRYINENTNVKSISSGPYMDLAQLSKFYGNTGTSEIYLNLSFTNDDLENIIYIKNNLEQFKLVYNNGYNHDHLQYFSQVENWNIEKINEYKEVEFRIINNNLQHLKDPQYRMFIEYLQSFHFFFTLAEENAAIKLKPILLFFGPYRSINADELVANLSVTNFNQEYANIHNATSRTPKSFIRLATTYWGQTRVENMYNAKNIGYLKTWNDNPDKNLITYYLKKLGYDWDLEPMQRNKNMFSILLKKNGKEIQLNDASSGEKEIINFLFGILSLNTKNGIILIDEPELHLHPKWQKLLLELFTSLAKQTKNQFIISTHSAVFINTDSLRNVIRIYKDSANASKNIELATDYKSPYEDMIHIINQTNNEKIFFAELVILVEGITDRLVFQRIFQEKIPVNSSLLFEIVDINGKNFYEKYKPLLEAFEIPSYFITDQDYLCNRAGESIQDLFTVDIVKANKNIKDKNSRDHERLITKIEAAISSNNCDELKDHLEVLKKEKRKLKPDSELDSTQIKKLETCINDLKTANIFVLRNGDIEKYFPEGYKKKDLEKVIKLLDDQNFPTWQRTNEYQLLSQLADEILESYKKRSARTTQPETAEAE